MGRIRGHSTGLGADSRGTGGPAKMAQKAGHPERHLARGGAAQLAPGVAVRVRAYTGGPTPGREV